MSRSGRAVQGFGLRNANAFLFQYLCDPPLVLGDCHHRALGFSVTLNVCSELFQIAVIRLGRLENLILVITHPGLKLNLADAA